MHVYIRTALQVRHTGTVLDRVVQLVHKYYCTRSDSKGECRLKHYDSAQRRLTCCRKELVHGLVSIWHESDISLFGILKKKNRALMGKQYISSGGTGIFF